MVNGAGGFLGSAVVETLCRAGWRVRATDLPESDLAPARQAAAEVIAADLLAPGAIPPLLHGVSQVVHLAGIFNYSLPYEVLYRANALLTERMAEAALAAKVRRFLHISSIAVYGRPRFLPMAESHPHNAANPYERSKQAGEEIVWRFCRAGLPAVVLRPAGIYGPRSRYGQAAFMALLSLLRHTGVRRLPVMRGGPKMHHVHVRDVADAVALILQAPEDAVRGRAFNVADDRPLAQGELFRALMPELDLEERFSYPWSTRLFWPFLRLLTALPENAFHQLNERLQAEWQKVIAAHGLKPKLTPRLERDFLGYLNADYLLDTSALKSLGFRPAYPDARPGLAETVRWYQAERWLPRF